MKRPLIFLSALTMLVLACGSAGHPNEAAASGPETGTSKGEQVYRMHCVLCHGGNGKLGFNGAKDLSISVLSKAEMIARVSAGKGTMQPYKNVLSPQEIEAVVAHVRGLKSK